MRSSSPRMVAEEQWISQAHRKVLHEMESRRELCQNILFKSTSLNALTLNPDNLLVGSMIPV